MILQALYDYYQRSENAPPEGFDKREIPFVICINTEGRFLNLEDTNEVSGKRRRGKELIVPRDRHTTGSNAWKTANLFWDHYGFVLGYPKDEREESRILASNQNKSFKDIIALAYKVFPDSTAMRAISLFYENKEWKEVFLHDAWAHCASRKGANLTFRIDGIGLITDVQEVKEFACRICTGKPKVAQKNESIAEPQGVCLVTGEPDLIARTHAATPIIGSRSNAKMVSFQKNSGYDSYGKMQGSNAPVSKRAEFAYTSALKALLGKDSLNKVFIGTDTAVYWAERAGTSGIYNLEHDFAWFFEDPPKDDLDRGVRAIRALYEAVHSGRVPVDEVNRFYVLGLAPNAARIAVRFWKVGTVAEFAARIKRHFDDLEIVRGPKDPDYLTLNQLLRATAFEYKMDNVPPKLAGAVVDSVLDGTPYPVTLAQQCIGRIRAERRVTRTRAAVLKAYVNRLRSYNEPLRKEEMTVSLDRDNTSPGYRLGRLFAVLEKIQEEANPGINATIRDRFYGAASSIPVAVFPQLFKLKNHHLAKISNPGRKVNLEKEIGEIFCGINDFPSHLSMEEQARFSIGYYHQRQSFFEK